KRALPAAVAALVVSVVSGFIVWTLRPASPGNVMRFAFTLPEGQQFTGQTRLMVALSPDGTRIVYAADQRLYMRSMSEIEPQAIPGTDGGANPVFSPDGNWLVFGSSDGTLRKIAFAGGAAGTTCDDDQFSRAI